jgi:DNA-binding beta-propeller fold protein YncE
MSLLCACTSKPAAVAIARDAGKSARFLAAGPRLLSNQTSQPIAVWGTGLEQGMKLLVSGAATLSLPLTVVDEGHAFGRLPANLEVAGGFAEGTLNLQLTDAQGTVPPLTLINDTHFPDLTALVLSPDGAWLFAASTPEDQVYALEVATGQVTRLPTDDGPSALAVWTDATKKSWLVVAHRYSPTLRLLPIAGGESTVLPALGNASALTVSGDLAYLAEQSRDTVFALNLADGAKEQWRTPVGPNPDRLAVVNRTLAVGCAQSGDVEWLEAASGKPLGATRPRPGSAIIGGRTQPFSKYVMNGSAARALAWSPKLSKLFVASIGPNIGPNPEKMEVSMNGGVAVLTAEPGAYLRHLGFGAGVTQALALDDRLGLLYAADISLGLVRVLDAKKLSQSDAGAAKALLQEIALPPPADFPLVRPAPDFAVNNRAGAALHSGPQALALSADGKTLWVLNRFTGTLARLDVTGAARGKALWKQSLPLANVLEQPDRRAGEILYFADLGRSGMSCDACHAEGHTGGILFEKTEPMRVYRSPTVRGSRLTPPYFTPASTRSMSETAKVVGGRNRFHNPDPTASEIERIALFAALIPTLPNPFVGADGAPTEALDLPDGHRGNPRAGWAVFEGKAGCAGCHPGPAFTTDQDPQTRGKYLDVGTPHLLPLREEMQNPHFSGFAPPALAGAWDVFPMLTTGLAGLGVNDDGTVVVDQRFALRRAVEGWPGKHGNADTLNAQEKDDLLAYLMSL